MSSAPSIRLVLLASLFVGCAQISKETAYVPAPPLPSFHAQIPEPVNQIRRVAVLPIAYQTPLEASLAGLDSALREELAKTSLFELVPISRQELDSRFNQRQFSSVEIVPAELLTTLRTEYGVDGVLFTELTSYRPYQPIAIGLRSKLIDAQSGRVRWAFDHLFDAGNLETAKAAEGYYLATNPPPAVIEPGYYTGAAVLQSPSRFTKYAAWEAFRSLLDKAAFVEVTTK
jgi:hypothetical protein